MSHRRLIRTDERVWFHLEATVVTRGDGSEATLRFVGVNKTRSLTVTSNRTVSVSWRLSNVGDTGAPGFDVEAATEGLASVSITALNREERLRRRRP